MKHLAVFVASVESQKEISTASMWKQLQQQDQQLPQKSVYPNTKHSIAQIIGKDMLKTNAKTIIWSFIPYTFTEIDK